MGRQIVTFTVSGSVSRHNSERDEQDDADWLQLCERMAMIAKEHRYERVVMDVEYSTH